MKLYLAQHGDSLPEEINSERPLSERGREDVQRVAQFVGAYGMRVKRVYHSGKLRARQTAELFATEVASEEAVEAVAGINPNDAVAHYNFGNLLAGRDDEASSKQFEEAVRADPRFAEAHFNLGLAYAARNRTAGALARFEQVVRLRPQFAPGHLNFGVALAKAGRYPEAISQFEETLRLDPSNADAKRFLTQAEALQKSATR